MKPITAIALILGTAALTTPHASNTARAAPALTSYTVYASGLNNPRGLKVGPDGELYVADAGRGGLAASASRSGLRRTRRRTVQRQHGRLAHFADRSRR